MNKNQLFTTALFSLVLLFGFQNCSKIDVSDLDSATNQKAQGNFEQVLDEEAANAMDEVPVSTLPADRGPGAEVDKDKEPAAEPDKEEVNVAEPDKDKDKEEGEDPIAEEPTDEEVVMLCLKNSDEAKSKKREIAQVETTTISKLRGHHVIESNMLELIENVRGKLTVKTKTEGTGEVQKIIDTRGALIICGMEVDSIENTRGHIVLVNSKVKSLKNHRGNVKLLSSEILETSDIRGNIKEIQSK